ncbi:15335_t:CDS:2 [Acaulospora morrowiae]|uniref:15335_t:CDS:1 n=1 Tax=Acaulospora morrowiae TaxID=94023 RepID=A0A9N9CT36_9GLOM|nr:15335_t:CDS:2 [Acaulospora morrowiae]
MEVTEEEWTVHDVIIGQGQGFIDEIKIHELVEEVLPDTTWTQLQEILNSLLSFGLVRKRQTHDERFLYQARTKEIAKKLQYLDDQEYEIYELIENSERKGIAKSDIQKQTKIVQSVVENCLKIMQDRKLIKEVKPKNKKLYMLFDVKPADESLSRLLYTNGEPDTVVVEALKTLCYSFIYHRSFPKDMDTDAIFQPGYSGYPTLAKVVQCVQETKVTELEIEEADIRQILEVLIHEGKIVKRFSGGLSDQNNNDGRHDSQVIYIAKKSRSMNNAWTPTPCANVLKSISKMSAQRTAKSLQPIACFSLNG